MKQNLFMTATVSLTLLLSACTHQSSQKMDEAKNAVDIPISKAIAMPDQPNIQLVEIQPPQNRIVKEDIYLSNYQQYPEVVRYDRYTLVSSSPIGGQKYLLEQLVNINMPVRNKAYTLTIEQGINNTLKDTGYSLCTFPQPEVRHLFRLFLPKVHYKFGPMKLRDALQMLAGEAFELTLNDTKREICFTPRSTLPNPSEPIRAIQAEVVDVDLAE